jgi:hypothetical protein
VVRCNAVHYSALNRSRWISWTGGDCAVSSMCLWLDSLPSHRQVRWFWQTAGCTQACRSWICAAAVFWSYKRCCIDTCLIIFIWHICIPNWSVDFMIIEIIIQTNHKLQLLYNSNMLIVRAYIPRILLCLDFFVFNRLPDNTALSVQALC